MKDNTENERKRVRGGSNEKAIDNPENTHHRGSITVRLTSCFFLWIQLLCLCWMNNCFTCLTKFKPVKQEVSRKMILPLWWCSLVTDWLWCCPICVIMNYLGCKNPTYGSNNKLNTRVLNEASSVPIKHNIAVVIPQPIYLVLNLNIHKLNENISQIYGIFGAYQLPSWYKR